MISRGLVFRLTFGTLTLALLTALAATAAAQAPAPTYQARPQVYALPYLADGSFEKPNLTPPDFCYGTSGTCVPPITQSPWSFQGGAGVATDGSGFTSLNPDTTYGDQVLFVQSTNSSVQQTVNAPAGHFRIRLWAAQRERMSSTDQQRVSVRIDGIEIDQIEPADGQYALFKSHTVQLTQGSHTVSLVGLNPLGTDNTLLIDDVRLNKIANNDNWTTPGAWATGSVPGPTTAAVIEAGDIVVLNTQATVQSLTIHGELHCANQDISLTADYILVADGGSFECGSEQSPFTDALTITLKEGTTSPLAPNMGQKFLGAMSGGRVELHGEPRVSWTRLAASVAGGGGTATLSLVDPVDWRVGDWLVLAPSNSDVTQGEAVQIATVIDAQTVTGAPANAHFGGPSETPYSNGLGKTWLLEERAEVGLLSRNITIEGEFNSLNPTFGAHTMFMAGSSVRVEGVEFNRVGQKYQLARYPFHWHQAQDVPGQYIRNCSIHRSFNRCVTVHGTNDALVQDNVCFDFYGHGFFLENGNEERNRFIGNLGITARKPENEALALLETDYRVGTASNGPAVFWITHLNNTYVGNVAAGSEGTGFWFAEQGPQPFEQFQDNLAHSSRQGLSTCFDKSGPAGITIGGGSSTDTFQGFTSNHNEQGVWPCAYKQGGGQPVFDDLIVANSENGMQAPNPVDFTETLFVGLTDANPSSLWLPDSNWRGIQVYDQGFSFDTVHFVNYDRPAMTAFYPGGGAHKLSSNRTRNITLDNAPHVFLDPNDFSHPGAGPSRWGDIVHDLDGSLLGSPSAIVSDHPLMYDDTCVQPTHIEIAGYACPYRYAHFRSEFGVAAEPIQATVIRSDGRHETSTHIVNRFITEIIADGAYHYSWRYELGLKHRQLNLDLRKAFPGDTAVYEILDVPSGVTIDTAEWTPASSLTDLMTGAGHRWFWRDQSLFLKLVASGAQWDAKDLVRICPWGSCNGPSDLSSLPSVTIHNPADGQRIPSGSGFTVSATLTDPEGIAGAAVYLGTTRVSGIGMVSFPGNKYSWQIPTQPDGAYPLKLVVRDGSGTGTSFTAVQQLFIGDPVPRVEITSIADNQTHDTGQPTTIDFALANWPLGGAGGKHLRLYVNNVDALGPITSTAPIAFSGLLQGRQDVKLALVDGTGGTDVVHAIHDVARIYGMGGVGETLIADFEDGPDWRGALTGTDVDVTEVKFAWNTADPEASRLDGQDDINYFDVIDDQNGTVGTAVFRLDLAPAQDWAATSLSRIQVYATAGSGFTLWIHDKAQGATLVGTSTGGGTTTFVLPGAFNKVEAIELHYDESALPSSGTGREHLHDIRLVQ